MREILMDYYADDPANMEPLMRGAYAEDNGDGLYDNPYEPGTEAYAEFREGALDVAGITIEQYWDEVVQFHTNHKRYPNSLLAPNGRSSLTVLIPPDPADAVMYLTRWNAVYGIPNE